MKKIVAVIVVLCLTLSFTMPNILATAPPNEVELTEEYIARADNRKNYQKDESSPHYLEKFIQKDLSSYEELYWMLKIDNVSSRVVCKFDLNDSAKSFTPYMWLAGNKSAKITVEASKDGRNWMEIISPVAVEYDNYYGDTSTMGAPTAWPEEINNENVNKVLADNPEKIVYLRFGYAGSSVDSELQIQAFGITAKYNTTPVSISIVKKPKVYYTAAEAIAIRDRKADLDLSTGKVEIIYADGTVVHYGMDDPIFNVTTDRTKIAAIGEHSVTVSAYGMTDTYNLTTLRGAVKSIEIKTLPKTTFEVGDAVDVTGGEITVNFNGTVIQPVVIPMSEEMVVSFNTNNITNVSYVTVKFGGETAKYAIEVLEKSETKDEDVRIDAQPYTSGEDGMELDDREEQEAVWNNEFGPDKKPNRKDLNLNDMITDCSYTRSYINSSSIWLDVFSGGHLTIEVDLPDRAVGFELTRGWGIYANCKVLASKDGGKTWYIVGRVIDEMSAMSTVFSSTQLSDEQIEKNYEWMLIGNPEKKFLLKFIPDMTEDIEGKIQICNLGYTVLYNVGQGNLDKDLPLTVPEDYQIPKEYDEKDYPSVVNHDEAYDGFEEIEGNIFDNSYNGNDSDDKSQNDKEIIPAITETPTFDEPFQEITPPYENNVAENIDKVTNKPNKKVTTVQYKVKVIKDDDNSLPAWLMLVIVIVSGIAAGAVITVAAFGVIIYIKKRKIQKGNFKIMKNVRIVSLLLVLLLTVCSFAGCKEAPEDNSSYYTYTSEFTSETGETLIGGDNTSDSSQTASGNSNITSSSGSDVNTPATDTPITSTPEIKQDENDKNAAMPKIDIKQKKVTVCIDWDSKNSWVQNWESAFKKAYPGITVSYKQATPEMKASKLSVWANSGQSPDAVYIKPEESWPDLVNKNLVDSVDKYININTPFWGSIKSTMDSLKIDGKYYALVTDMSIYGHIIYNPSVFKNAGLTDPEILLYNNQWTWTKFEEYAKKLTKINSTDSSKSKYGVTLRYPEVFILTTGKDLIEYSNGKWKSNLNGNSTKSAIEYLRKLGPTGNKYAVSGETDPTTIRKMTINGQVGMYVTAESPGLEFPEEMKKGTLKYVPTPRCDSASKYYCGATVDAFYIPKGAKNPEGGVAYACAVRGYDIGLLNVKTEKNYTDGQEKIEKYAKSIVTGVPLQFRRLSGTIEYYNIYGPTYHSGDSYSGVVAEWEPRIMEALKKQ